jgi:uncharacterized glyoxalase superfamily protein PhnB
MPAAIAYYRDQLGFRVDWFEESIHLAGLSTGQCRLFLAGPAFRSGTPSPTPQTTWLNLDSAADVDALYQAWLRAGAKLLSTPERKPWGLHEFTAEDLDGNRLRVFYDVAGENK